MQLSKTVGRAMLAAAIIACSYPVLPASAATRGDLSRACWDTASLAGKPQERLSRWQAAGTQPLPAMTQPSAQTSPIVGTVRRVKLPPGRKLVALTFDLCEAAQEVAGY